MMKMVRMMIRMVMMIMVMMIMMIVMMIMMEKKGRNEDKNHEDGGSEDIRMSIVSKLQMMSKVHVVVSSLPAGIPS